jgi:pimeloyl-ACP methyl ester carboxylesterase
MPTVHVRGVDLHYKEWGSGPSLLMAHGLTGSIAWMSKFAEHPEAIAARGLHVVAYDARGHGESGYTTKRADYRWRSLSEDMYALIRALDLAPLAICGGSMGAGTALQMTLDHPDAVDKLILMSPPPFGKHMRAAKRYLGTMSWMYQLFGASLTARLPVAAPAAKRAQRAHPGLDLRTFWAGQRRAAVVPAIRGLLFDPQQLPTERFGEIGQSALILTHPDDPVHPLESGDLLYAAMPHARLAVAPTATYWEEHAEALTHVIAAFVRGEPIAAGLPEKNLHQH